MTHLLLVLVLAVLLCSFWRVLEGVALVFAVLVYCVLAVVAAILTPFALHAAFGIF